MPESEAIQNLMKNQRPNLSSNFSPVTGSGNWPKRMG